MRFVLIGTGTLVPDPDRGPAGFLVESEGARILIDGGSGTIQRLARHGVDARSLDGGVYSHRHLDHCGDLPSLLFAMRVGVNLHRGRPYPIWAGEGFRAFLSGLEDLYGAWIRTASFHAEVTELSLSGPASALLPGGVRLETLPAVHSAGALHLRFTGPNGAVVVFSGDTGPSDNLVQLATGADVLVTECAVADRDPYGGHLTPADVAAVVDAARPRRVVLTHFYPSLDPVQAVATVARVGVPVERGSDGQILAF